MLLARFAEFSFLVQIALLICNPCTCFCYLDQFYIINSGQCHLQEALHYHLHTGEFALTLFGAVYGKRKMLLYLDFLVVLVDFTNNTYYQLRILFSYFLPCL